MKNIEITDNGLTCCGINSATIKRLARLGIQSLSDLLFHLPMRYQDRTRIQTIQQLKPDEDAVVEGYIVSVSQPRKGRTKWLFELQETLSEGEMRRSDSLYLRFFNLHPFQQKIFKVGAHLRCYGEVRWGREGREMIHPETLLILPDKPLPVDAHLTAIYPAGEGISQNLLRKAIHRALAYMEIQPEFEERLPPAVLASFSFPSLKEALRFVHQPPGKISLSLLAEKKTLAQRRLIFEELLAHRLSLLQLKHRFRAQTSVPLTTAGLLVNRFQENLPFQLTGAQRRVVEEIRQDLAQGSPALRLIQGDVGSGKTVVAALALLQAVEKGYQAALMAPTELLAEQHGRTLQNWLAPLNVEVIFLSGKIKGKERQAILQKIASDEPAVMIGTHALFQEAVHFSRLALIIVDEQHRFGVHQRALLRKKAMQAGWHPHQLIMTATPIPRTLAMGFYADLDMSIINELPPGRVPVTTRVISDTKRDAIIARIYAACKEGRQVYWVCPFIEESETIDCQAAMKTAETLQASLPDVQIGLIHGQMRAEEKQMVMQAFQQGKIAVLVATTIIEVGVDVPLASVMVIENAERLGLSQLHQLRGRVGRSDIASFCILLYQSPLSPLARQRLEIMRATQDGFQIAERDLELRGPGEVLGVRQTGDLSFRVADLSRDSDLLAKVHHTAEWLLRDYPDWISPLIARWLKEDEEYGKV